MAAKIYSFPDGKLISGSKEKKTLDPLENIKKNPQEALNAIQELTNVANATQNVLNEIITYCSSLEDDSIKKNISEIISKYFKS